MGWLPKQGFGKGRVHVAHIIEDPRRGRGSAAEALACKLLAQFGYRILERNFRCKLGELDIVADDHGTLVFIEVRSRSDDRFGRAQVGLVKQRQVSRVASWYLVQRRPGQRRMRFDVVVVTAGVAALVIDAWRLGQ